MAVPPGSKPSAPPPVAAAPPPAATAPPPATTPPPAATAPPPAAPAREASEEPIVTGSSRVAPGGKGKRPAATSSDHQQPKKKKKKNKYAKKKICDCPAHDIEKWPCAGEIDIPSCSNKCPYCEYSPKGKHLGAVIRKHVRSQHIGENAKDRLTNPRYAMFLDLSIAQGSRGRYQFEEDEDDDDEDEDEEEAEEAEEEPAPAPTK
ncbi:hypothetical protein MaudCBS49596_008060 [Microsporum audouinii]